MVQEEEETQSDEEYLEKQRKRDKVKRKAKEINPVADLNDDFISLGRGVVSEEDEEDEVLEASKKKKKGKKNCVPGAVWHDELGRFTDKADAKSFSLQFSKSDADCRGGVAKMPGQRFTKIPCGRKSKHSKEKAKHKCKDGSLVSDE
jgi:hypothetical protein